MMLFKPGGEKQSKLLDVSVALEKSRTKIALRKKIRQSQRIEMYRNNWVRVFCHHQLNRVHDGLVFYLRYQ